MKMRIKVLWATQGGRRDAKELVWMTLFMVFSFAGTRSAGMLFVIMAGELCGWTYRSDWRGYIPSRCAAENREKEVGSGATELLDLDCGA